MPIRKALDALKRAAIQYKDQNIDLIFGREKIAQWIVDFSKDRKILRILDLGCGRGDDLETITLALQRAGFLGALELYGIECYSPSQKIAEAKGIRVFPANIENDELPFENKFFDIVLSNQTLEHTKEIFWIFSETSRVLKAGGLSISGFPNLTSFHNRLLMLFGIHPTSIQMLGPHVRGISYDTFQEFVEVDGYFEVLDYKGGHFYPLPRMLAKFFSNLFPKASASLFIMVVRTEKPGEFKEVLANRFFETPFYTGPKDLRI